MRAIVWTRLQQTLPSKRSKETAAGSGFNTTDIYYQNQ
jgi:hypothetical protein